MGDSERSAEAHVEAALRRIGERDAIIRAWLHVDAAGALASARALDRAAPQAPGGLYGVPIAVKDVFDTAAMPTTHNSPLFGATRPAHDAAAVAVLRAAGAIVLGKTDTTEFAAAGRNAATANPHDIARTPGGSSSGSAAAVSDGHVRLALATQTGGSTIRPASFCGIHGFKPTWGAISREGMKLYAASLDTVGFHARSVDDLDLLCAAFGMSPADMPPDRLRIGVCRTPFWDAADTDGRAAFGRIADALRDAGADTVPLTLPPPFADANAIHRAILFREGAAAFLPLARTQGSLLHPDFHARVASAATYDDAQLRAAYDAAAEARIAFERIAEGFDAVLAPSAPGIAPLGRGPGDPVLNQLWTLIHVPVVSLPLARGAGGMPIGVSLVARRFDDRRLLAVARRVEEMLAPLGIMPTCAP